MEKKLAGPDPAPLLSKVRADNTDGSGDFLCGFPGSSALKNPPAMQETLVRFLGQEDPLEKGQATHSNILGFSWWLRQ